MKKILVVDDKANVQKALQIGLSRKGYHVDVAEDGLSALEKVAENGYDVMLSDIRMPFINGFVLASKVAEHHPDIRIILMSAYDFNDFEQNDKDLEQFPKLSKPFELKELLNILDGWFQDKTRMTDYAEAAFA